MRVKSLEVKNFYSFKSLELDFDDYDGIVRILGINEDSDGKSGAGKSSVFESIVWGIFGKTVRKSTEEAYINAQAGSGCSVKIILEKEGLGLIEIERCKRPTSLNFSVDGVSKNKENASETQKHIEELLETDFKSFQASVIFGQHVEGSSFLDSSAEDKRTIIRNCFNLDDLFSRRLSVKQLKLSYGSELKVLEPMAARLTKEKEALESQVVGSKYKYIQLPSLESILSAEKEMLMIDNSIKTLQTTIKKNKDKSSKLKDSIDLGVYSDHKECPVCKGSYLKCQTQEDLKSITSDYNALLNQIDSDEHSINDLKAKKDSIKPEYSSSEWAKYNEKNKLIEDAQRILDRLQEVSNQLDEHQSRMKELQSLTDIMKFWEVAFSEKGLIKYIIRNILDYFNLKSNEYLSVLTNNQFSIQFNDELSETVKNNGLETKYVSLSGGEKRKLNLAIMLALQDLSSKISRTNFNMIFFDEVCDNIDDNGILAVGNLLNSLKDQYPDKILFVITHNNTLQDLLSESKSITIKKVKGISRLVNGS